MYKRGWILAVLLTGLVFAGGAYALQNQQQSSEQSAFMQAKLRHTQEVVKGLALENFEAISKGANSLMLMSHESSWNVITTQEYLDLSAEFRLSANRLREAAKQKNIDGATLAYFEVTLNCVRCHKQTRPKIHSSSGQDLDK